MIHKEMKINKYLLTHTNTRGKKKAVLQHSLSAVTKFLKYIMQSWVFLMLSNIIK